MWLELLAGRSTQRRQALSLWSFWLAGQPKGGMHNLSGLPAGQPSQRRQALSLLSFWLGKRAVSPVSSPAMAGLRLLPGPLFGLAQWIQNKAHSRVLGWPGLGWAGLGRGPGWAGGGVGWGGVG